jgi:hypothetical protein
MGQSFQQGRVAQGFGAESENRPPPAALFLGTWNLVHCEHIHLDERTTYPPGPGPHGRSTYTSDGRVHLTIDGPSIAALLDPNSTTARIPLSYTGRFEATETYLVHHIETCTWPELVGRTHPRRYAFRNNRLIISLAALPAPGITSFIWERVGKAG